MLLYTGCLTKQVWSSISHFGHLISCIFMFWNDVLASSCSWMLFLHLPVLGCCSCIFLFWDVVLASFCSGMLFLHLPVLGCCSCIFLFWDVLNVSACSGMLFLHLPVLELFLSFSQYLLPSYWLLFWALQLCQIVRRSPWPYRRHI